MTQPDSNAAPGAPDGAQPADDAAPWGDDANFDPDKAKKLIANLRGENTKLKNREVLTDEHKQRLAALDKLEADAKSDLDKARDEVTRWQTDAETWRKAAVGSKIHALAATEFADPSDAVTALSANNYLDAGGQIDEAAITRDLGTLLESKPHYRRAPDAPSGPRPPAPNPAQGAAGSSSTGPAADFAATLATALANG